MHIDDLLRLTVAKGASDLHLKAGGVPILRIDGELVPQKQLPEMTSEDMERSLRKPLLMPRESPLLRSWS